MLLRSHAELFGLAGVSFLGNLAHAVLPSVTVLYMMYRYGWDERTVGLTMAGVGVAAIIVQGIVVGPVTARIGERPAFMVGLAFGVAGFVVVALAQAGAGFLASIPLLALWGLANPGLLALMSRFVSASEQGQFRAPMRASWASPICSGLALVHAGVRVRDRRRGSMAPARVAVLDRGVAARGRRHPRVARDAALVVYSGIRILAFASRLRMLSCQC